MGHFLWQQQVSRPVDLGVTCDSPSRSVSEEVFLRPLTDKFSRLLLQLLARYSSWLRLATSSAEDTVNASSNERQVVLDYRWCSIMPVDAHASAIVGTMMP